MIKEKLEDPKDFILRLWTYFRRGHSTYLVLLISFTNFIVIQYRLLIQHVPALRLVFSSLTIFGLFLLVFYPILAILIGWYDYKKLAVPVDTRLIAKASPWNQDLAKAIILIAKGKNDEAIKVLEKWTGDINKY